ncbi:hypothetical protein WJ542_04095 [Paraburkholderia sp. B3]|uniref:hypothetical protein n=1 Tax=Paraburkholderia sp. B3 TaxID=3134791 RepID=UPI003982CE08
MSENYEHLRDAVLGYDDTYRSTEGDRVRYFVLWNAVDARLGMVIDMIHDRKVIARDPRHDGERVAADLTRAAIVDAMERAKRGGRPAN